MLPLLLLIPLIILGVIILWFVLKAVVGFVLTVFLWGLGIFFALLIIYIVYLIIVAAKGKSLGESSRRSYSKVKECVGDACKLVKGGK